MTYDPKNNDTYDTIYSFNLAQDVECHMFKNPQGSVVITGADKKSIRGDFSEESRVIAKNNVLHFAKHPALKSVKLLKHKELSNVIPLSLMTRYERALKDCTYTQKNPVFFDLEKEKFVRLLDKRFLRDLKDEHKKGFIASLNSEDILIKDNQVALCYESLDCLYGDTSRIFEQVHEAYLTQLTYIYPTQDVIIIAYHMAQGERPYFNSLHHAVQDNILYNGAIDFEFIKAKKLDEKNYCIYQGDKVMLKNFFFFDKNKKNDVSHFFLGENNSLLIMPYSDNSWNTLLSIKKDIDSVFHGLTALLMRQKTSNLLDAPLSDIASDISDNLLIEYKKAKPK